MNKLITKARSGVTLVELLVVILIVTILSVSMLPLLKPFVVEAQYAAEAIPNIGNLRTKIGLYQYDKSKLPTIATVDTSGAISQPIIESWVPSTDGNTQAAPTDWASADLFIKAYADFPGSVPPISSWTEYVPASFTGDTKHFGALTDIDWQELKGKRSRPHHYQYLVMYNGSDYAYFIGCFGDGNGLAAGTGYAVCEIVSLSTNHKYVGTWRRYKSVSTDNSQICFTSDKNASSAPDGDLKHLPGCYVPIYTDFPALGADNGSGGMTVIDEMIDRGWEFQ